MHHQFTEALFIELADVDGPHRAAILRQRLGGGAALRCHQITDGFSSEARLARNAREVAVDPWSTPRAIDRNDGK
jgi:hypothetical protein